MQIQVNTDKNIKGSETLTAEVTETIESALGRLSEHITRVEVHLSDENSNKKSGDNDIRCVLEARLEGRPPVAVTDESDTIDAAVAGAAEKMTRMIDSTLEKIRDLHRQTPHPPVVETVID